MVNYDLHRSRSRSDTVSQLLAQLAEVSGSSPGPDADASSSPGTGPSFGAVVPSSVEGTGAGAGGGEGWADRPMGLLRGISGSGGQGKSQSQKLNQDQDPNLGQGKVKGVEGTTAVDISTTTSGREVVGGGSGSMDIPLPPSAPLPPSSSSSTSLSFDKVLPPKTLRRSARALYRYLSNTLSSKTGKTAATTTTAGGTRARMELSDPLLPDPITGAYTHN